MAGIVRLDVDILDFSILNCQSVSFASVHSEYGCRVEFDIKSFSEGASRIAQEADAAAFVWIEGLSPRVHAVESKIKELAVDWTK